MQLLGRGTILREVLAAAEMLESSDWSVAADVWSVTSFTELRRDGMTSPERRNAVHAVRAAPRRRAGSSSASRGPTGPVIAASDYVRAVADLIRAWVPRRYVALGTDGFGRSDTRAALRAFFEVDRAHRRCGAGRARRASPTTARCRGRRRYFAANSFTMSEARHDAAHVRSPSVTTSRLILFRPSAGPRAPACPRRGS